jgi:hypothetical protein
MAMIVVLNIDFGCREYSRNVPSSLVIGDIYETAAWLSGQNLYFILGEPEFKPQP